MSEWQDKYDQVNTGNHSVFSQGCGCKHGHHEVCVAAAENSAGGAAESISIRAAEVVQLYDAHCGGRVRHQDFAFHPLCLRLAHALLRASNAGHSGSHHAAIVRRFRMNITRGKFASHGS